MKEDLIYLNEHCDRLKSIKGKIIDLRQYVIGVLSSYIKPIEGCKFLRTVEFSNLDSWDISYKKSKSIDILINKLIYMIDKGDVINVYPLLNSICSNKIKKQTRPKYEKNGFNYKANFLGYGHFRFNEVCIVFTDIEIKILKEYFEL